jgi:hypothetical protein
MSRRVIADVAKLIGDPTKWCQGALARSKKGFPTTPLNASSWDAIGAVYAVLRIPVNYTKPMPPYHKDDLAITLATMQMAAVREHRMSMELVNDNLGHAEVMSVLRVAWRMAEPDEEREAA